MFGDPGLVQLPSSDFINNHGTPDCWELARIHLESHLIRIIDSYFELALLKRKYPVFFH